MKRRLLFATAILSAFVLLFAACSHERPIEAGRFDVCKDGETTGVIVASIPNLRDPFVLLDNGVYYVYGTGWECYKNTTEDLLGPWENMGRVVTVPKDAVDNFWAPEVYLYNDAYYMFTTYMSAKNGTRGCAVFRSTGPQGPFVEISDGVVTPSDWYAIDGTLYVDGSGQPWMIFVREWVSTFDNIGRMMAAKMSSDLTRFVSEPIELFRADSPNWTDAKVTDGPWMHRLANGTLLMLWSNYGQNGYAVGIARSTNGEVDGDWVHYNSFLYDSSMGLGLNGGHGMTFRALGGQLYLALHLSRSSDDINTGKPAFIPLREESDTLVWYTTK